MHIHDVCVCIPHKHDTKGHHIHWWNISLFSRSIKITKSSLSFTRKSSRVIDFLLSNIIYSMWWNMDFDSYIMIYTVCLVLISKEIVIFGQIYLSSILSSRFYQKYLILCSDDEWRSYRFGKTWGCVINNRIFIFGWTVPFNGQMFLYKNRQCGCSQMKQVLFIRLDIFYLSLKPLI